MSLEKILVLGSTGFIGSNFIRHISVFHQEAFEVVVWSRKRHGDLFDVESLSNCLQLEAPQVVVNAAWVSTANPSYRASEQNLKWITKVHHLHKICADLGVFVVSLGTDSENNPEVQNLYVNSKRTLYSKLFESGLLQHSAWLQPSFVFSFEDLRPNLLRSAMANPSRLDLLLHQPDTLNDYVHIFDVSSAIMHLITQRTTGRFLAKSGFRMQNLRLMSSVVEFPNKYSFSDSCFDSTQDHSTWYPKFSQKVIQAYVN
jgi:hypothetical protein